MPEEIVDLGGGRIAREMDAPASLLALLAAAQTAGFDPTSPSWPGEGSGGGVGSQLSGGVLVTANSPSTDGAKAYLTLDSTDEDYVSAANVLQTITAGVGNGFLAAIYARTSRPEPSQSPSRRCRSSMRQAQRSSRSTHRPPSI